MSTQDDLQHLRRTLPAPVERSLDLADHARLRTSLLQTVAAPSRPPRRRLPAAAGPVVLTLLVCTAVLVGGFGSGPATTPPAARPDLRTARFLEQAALVAARTPVSAPRADQFGYLRTLTVTNEGGYDGPVRLGAAHERQVWSSQDPGAVRTSGLIREFGQDWPIESGGPSRPGPSRPTYAWLASLPTDPQHLLTELRADLTVGPDQDVDQRVFETIGELLDEAVMPPRTTAALYRAAGLIPEVTMRDDAVDAAGRHGVGLVRDDASFPMRTEWIFDPVRMTFLGTRWYELDPAGPTLFGSDAVMERGVSDRSGQRP